MRRANTTFVNLRAALDDVDPLVDASKPVAQEAEPFLDQLRPLPRDAKPTVRDLRIDRLPPGRRQRPDRADATRSPRSPSRSTRRAASIDVGGGAQDVGETEGAFPETVEAFKDAAPMIAFGRPYTPDFLGWLDDFSTTAAASTRSAASRARSSQRDLRERSTARSRGAREPQAVPTSTSAARAPPRSPRRTSSNVLSDEEQKALDCKEDDRATGR